MYYNYSYYVNYDFVDETRQSTSITEKTNEDIIVHYRNLFGRTPTVKIWGEILAFKDHMEDDVICCVIDETAEAARPSWYYTRAILNRLVKEGVKTIKDYEQRQKKYQENYLKKLDKSKIMSQREIKDADFEKGYYVDVMAYNKAEENALNNKGVLK